MDKFKFIKGVFTDEVVVNKPNTELAVDINGNVITAGQKNDKVFQDKILDGVNDNSTPLKIYTVTGEMLKPVASLSPNRQTLTLDRIICRDSSREGNALPAKVKTSFENINNYGNPTLKFSGTKTWNIGGNTTTICELQLNDVSYNKNAVLKASGHLTKHTFVRVGDGPLAGRFHPGVTLDTSEISSGAFLNGKHYDDAKTYDIKTLEESSVWDKIKQGDAWKCRNSSGSVLYAVSTENEISTNNFTLESDLTDKIKSRENFTIRKYAYTTTETKSIILSGGINVGYTYVNLNGCSLAEANIILKEKYGDSYEVKNEEGQGNVVYNGGFPRLYGSGSLNPSLNSGPDVSLPKTFSITPVYKLSESATFVLNKNLVYAKKEDNSIISAPSGCKVLVDGNLTSNVEGKTSGIVYDGDVQLIGSDVYKGSTEDETIYYNMSDETVEITDNNYKFTGDEGHEINADKILYEKKDITYSVDFVD